jgi:hypothetical protein
MGSIITQGKDKTNNILNQVQRLVDQLTPLDQLHLLEYLISRIARIVVSSQSTPSVLTRSIKDAWQEFFRIGDELAASDTPERSTLTATVLAMRR